MGGLQERVGGIGAGRRGGNERWELDRLGMMVRI
jgi:hypothetical protein